MKKYTKPTMNGEMFVANEYIGACWIVDCNVPGAYISDAKLYSESNGVTGLQTTGDNPDKLLGKFGWLTGGCGGTHDGVISSETESLPYNGYWVANGTTYNVYWWNEHLKEGSSDYHATTTPNTATTNPNAS